MLRTTCRVLQHKIAKILIPAFISLIPAVNAMAVKHTGQAHRSSTQVKHTGQAHRSSTQVKHTGQADHHTVTQHGTQPRKASFYADAGLGINILNSPTSSFLTSVTAGTSTFHDFTHNTRMISSSPAVSIGIGYIHPVNRWFNLGLRVFARYANNFGSVFALQQRPSQGGNQGGFSSAFHVALRNFEYGLDLTPSVNIGANQFLSGIFGIASNRAELRTTTRAITATGPGTLENTMRRGVTGVRLGYSLEELMSQNFSVYMSYIWTGYGSIAIKQSQPSLSFRSNNEINLQTHNILVGIRYYFSPQRYLQLKRAMLRAMNHHYYARFAFGSLIPQFESSNDFIVSINNNTNSTQALRNGYQGAPSPMTLLGLGYGFFIHHLYLGLETLMNINLANIFSKSEFNLRNISGAPNFTPSDKNLEIRLNTVEAALDLKLGGKIAPQTLLTGRVGMSVNHILMTQTGSVVYSGFITPEHQVIEERINKSVLGFRFGAGIEKLFTNNLSLAMNYVFTYYGHIFGSARNVPPVQGGPNTFAVSNASARVATHQITIGVNYYFA